MPSLTFKGRAKVKILDHNCEHKRGKFQIGILFEATACFGRRASDTQPSWVTSPKGLEIVGTFYLMKNDGSRGDVTIESLMKAFPEWDGDDMDSWNEGKYIGKEAQIETKEEEYPVGSGKKSIKVAYLNPFDFEPGFQHPTQKFGKLSQAMEKRAAQPANGQEDPFAGFSEENVPF